MSLITLNSGVVISRSCASRMHHQCRESACNCACGCNNGKPSSNMTARRSSECTAGRHTSCFKQSGAPCPCYCHEQIKPVKSVSLDNIGVATKLKPVLDEINKQLFLIKEPYTPNSAFYGDTMRKYLFGQFDNNVDVYKVVWDFSKNTDTYINYWPFVEKHLDTFRQGEYHVITLPDGQEIKIKLAVSINPSVIENYEKPIWSCDGYTYRTSLGIGNAGNGSLTSNGSLSLLVDYKELDNPQEVLEEGLKLCQKYNWDIDQNAIINLGKAINRFKPLENTHELVIGFRNYNLVADVGYNYRNPAMDKYTLRGQHDAWPSEKLTVSCPDFKEHVKNVGEDWRGRGTGSTVEDCGIYVYKDPSECLFHYGMSNNKSTVDKAMAMVYSWGVIGEFEKGYRVEHCKIVKMWIWDKNKRLTDNYHIEEIISGAEFKDFLYDPEVIQVAEMNKLKEGSV